MLTVGGRYVCGNPKSLMPVWADTNGGPLNYIQIADLIAFIRAPSTQEYTRRTPEFNEPIIGARRQGPDVQGLARPDVQAGPERDPVPDCYKGEPAAPRPPRSRRSRPDATILDVTRSASVALRHARADGAGRQAVRASTSTTRTPALDTTSTSASRTGDGRRTDNPIIELAQTTTYTIPPSRPGTYTFICSVHPIPAMTGTLTVK